MNREYNVLTGVLKSRLEKHTLNKTLKKIHHLYDIGKVKNNFIFFDHNDYLLIEKHVQDNFDVNSMFEELSSDRIELSQSHLSEKRVNVSVFSNVLWIASLTKIPLIDNEYSITKKNSYLAISPEEIDIKKIDFVIMIENGAVFKIWRELINKVNINFDNMIIIYRGHGEITKTTHRWIKNLPQRICKIAIFDTDPAGFAMSIQQGFDGFIAPINLHKNWEIKFSQDDVFCKQTNNIKFLSNWLSSRVENKTTNYIRDKIENKIALMQEHLMHANCEFEIFYLN